MMFAPNLDMLPGPQRALWPELADTPKRFVLYGGTAIALRFGHRASVDFDFFSFEPFIPQDLQSAIPYLQHAAVLRSAPNTLTCRVERGGPVRISYFGLSLGQAAAPEAVTGPGLLVAMPIDLGGTKVAVVTQRAEPRDYFDVHALLGSGLSLPEMLGAALVIYGSAFSPLVALKALAYHGDPALVGLPAGLQRDLVAAVKDVDLSKIPVIRPFRQRGDRL
jgi:hypothetical protein